MTKKRLIMAAAIAVGLILTSIALAGGGGGKKHDSEQFRAHLTGYNETPAVNTAGRGDVQIEISDDAITFHFTYSNLTGNPAVAHIHFSKNRVAGGVMVFFCGGGGQPACPASTSGSFTGTITAANVVGPTTQGIAVGDFDSVVKAIEANAGYANMHTAQFPSGEIRGQLRDPNADKNKNGSGDRH